MTPLEDGSTREPQPDATPEATQGAPAEAVAPPLSLVGESADEAETDGDTEDPRRYPSTIGGLIYLLVLVVMLGSLLVVARRSG